MNLSWLNPVNWIKEAIATKAEKTIDEILTPSKLEQKGRETVNYLIQLSESRMNDEKVKIIAEDLIYAGESMIDLGKAIHPESEEGRKLSEREITTLNARVRVLFGDVLADCDIENARKKLKEVVRKTIGLEG